MLLACSPTTIFMLRQRHSSCGIPVCPPALPRAGGWAPPQSNGRRSGAAPRVQELERYKAAFSRPGSLTAAINYYRASFASTTKWWTAEVDK